MNDVRVHVSAWPGARLLTRLPAWFRLLVVAVAVFCCGVIASRPADATDDGPLTGDVAVAAAAVDVLVDPRPGGTPLASFPADFADVTARAPQVVTAPDGTARAIDPTGGCSGPAGDTEWDFGVACRAHDLGYDLLRYAEHKGRPLPPEARRALDARLAADMHDQCELNPRGDRTGCHAVAQLYAAGLEFNSWRQRWGPPGHEPVLAWSFGSAVVVFLIIARLPRRRAAHPPAVVEAGAEDRFTAFLRLVGLGLVIVGQSLLTVLHWAGVGTTWVWLLTWVLQTAAVFYFAGGHANLVSWRATQAAGGGYGRYLASRTSRLLRPVLAFVLAWLVLPLPLELLDVPKDRVEVFGRLIAHPLWFLGLYLVAVAATPVTAWLHRRARLAAPLGLLGAMIAVDLLRIGFEWRTGGYLNLVLGALFLQQLGFHHADGGLARVPRRVLVACAALTAPLLPVLIAVGGYPRTMMPVPGEDGSNLSPPTVCLLLLGLGQLCVVLLVRERLSARLGGHRLWRLVEHARRAPMTLYLGYLTALAAVIGLLGLLDAPASFGWVLARPRWLAVLVLLLLPVLLVFHRFERAAALVACHTRETHRTRLAATLGVGYGVLGVLGFVVTGFSGTGGTLVVLEVDVLQNLIHLLLGWYLLHTVRTGACHGRRPWLLAALACVPPLLVLEPTAAMVVLHTATIAVALLAAIPKQDQRHADEQRQPAQAFQQPERVAGHGVQSA
ncbi:phospholipase A2 [Saccharothrix obliqua]|uniref:phospholipase A2 n=1 Tax=Saccharothrix obliqua TaxID=2861747 RepID=UPI001C5CCA4E|nr:phospholipase A2 [Saccharothrix obliqua]MBW4716329.1 phospholipase [Saccharothrix obliqua]